MMAFNHRLDAVSVNSSNSASTIRSSGLAQSIMFRQMFWIGECYVSLWRRGVRAQDRLTKSPTTITSLPALTRLRTLASIILLKSFLNWSLSSFVKFGAYLRRRHPVSYRPNPHPPLRPRLTS